MSGMKQLRGKPVLLYSAGRGCVRWCVSTNEVRRNPADAPGYGSGFRANSPTRKTVRQLTCFTAEIIPVDWLSSPRDSHAVSGSRLSGFRLQLAPLSIRPHRFKLTMRPFDLQVNGYAGVDFCSSTLTGKELQIACQALQRDGVDGVLATVITDSVESLVSKLKNLVRLREQDGLARRIISGFHIEGPFLNPTAGFIGAHPPEAAIRANPDDANRLLDAAGGLARVMTLAPEQDPGNETTRMLVHQGVTVAAGHCDPSLTELRSAIDAGLSMVTHFGNGCPVELPRHDNVLQRFLACRKDLWISFIPDGAHVSFFALRNYLDLVGTDRAVMVTDAISAATLGPGLHEVSGMTVEVDSHGVARKPGSANLAGSTITMPGIRKNLAVQLGLDDDSIRRLIDKNPRRAIAVV